ncbi:sensor histidine kinase [Streptomyces sp. JJ36]|uniref:sensor histidine kinase n=1 Tax=Streptomyces sp. JJ36 TaxID=2736645 RepID=UPI001F3D9983|nr:sensor histidine kinase [Streptomyces sp. JJ36]MCF6524962.1 sensor histidine kinase [Streptomyces sp. JJ36]
MRVPRPRSLAGQLFAMQVVLVTVLVAGCSVFAYVKDQEQAEESARHRATATARAVADSPSVREAIRTDDPSALLQPYAERVRKDTGVTFITIMNPEGVRWTHPNPERIGGTFVGHTGPALRGETFTETYTGTLGPSVRVVTPVRDRGRITGLVSAGIAVEAISEQVREQVTALLVAAGLALAAGGLGTYWVNARLRRHTHGMNAAELSRMHDYHQATLHAVREGLVMLDGQRRIALINDGARELLGLTGPEVVGRNVAELGLPAPLTGALLASEPRVDEVHLTADRVVVVNTSPVSGGERRGTVVTLRDHTELQSLAGELDSVRGFAEALRAQAHEAANRLHTVVSLIELGRAPEAVEFATEELELAQALTDQVVAAVAEPVLAALLLGKAAQANERGVELVLTPDSRIDDGLLPAGLPARDLVTVVGNLVDNAVEAAARTPARDRTPRVSVTVRAEREPATATVPDGPGDGGPGQAGNAAGAAAGDAAADAAGDALTLLVRVADTGPGVDAASVEEVFRRGWTTKPGANGGDGAPGPDGGHGLGLALVRQAVRRHGGGIVLTGAAAGGAEFTVRLPLGPGARGRGASGDRDPAAAEPVAPGGLPGPGASGPGGPGAPVPPDAPGQPAAPAAPGAGGGR